jgi:hypothetical protein
VYVFCLFFFWFFFSLDPGREIVERELVREDIADLLELRERHEHTVVVDLRATLHELRAEGLDDRLHALPEHPLGRAHPVHIVLEVRQGLVEEPRARGVHRVRLLVEKLPHGADRGELKLLSELPLLLAGGLAVLGVGGGPAVRG